MGKSNAHVLPWYRGELAQHLNTAQNVVFLGCTGPDAFTQSFAAASKSYYDLTLGNWQINDTEWTIPKGEADLVVCTRCPYFAEDPARFIDQCLELVKPGGSVFVDWGLGDHWRKTPYKVGWVRDNNHEVMQYGEHHSPLWSCFWDDALEYTPEAVQYREHVRKFGYGDEETLSSIIKAEVPHIVTPEQRMPSRVALLFLWPEAPQLYIATTFVKD